MPTVEYKASVCSAADRYNLTLLVTHTLVVGNPQPTAHHLKTPFPPDVDVFLPSNLEIILAGALDYVNASPSEIVQSQLAQHLVEYLRTNSKELGVATISGAAIDANGEPCLSLTSSRVHTPKPSQMVYATLARLKLEYIWQTIGSTYSQASALSQPFSRQLSLPFRTVLDDVVSRFVTSQLTRPYPLIFGPWCQQLDLEAPFLKTMILSVFSIIERSSNADFQTTCRRLIKAVRRKQTKDFVASALALKECLGSLYQYPAINTASLSDEAMLTSAMEFVFRRLLRRAKFKGSYLFRLPDPTADEGLIQQLTSAVHDDKSVDEVMANALFGTDDLFLASILDFPLPEITVPPLSSGVAINEASEDLGFDDVGGIQDLTKPPGINSGAHDATLLDGYVSSADEMFHVESCPPEHYLDNGFSSDDWDSFTGLVQAQPLIPASRHRPLLTSHDQTMYSTAESEITFGGRHEAYSSLLRVTDWSANRSDSHAKFTPGHMPQPKTSMPFDFSNSVMGKWGPTMDDCSQRATDQGQDYSIHIDTDDQEEDQIITARLEGNDLEPNDAFDVLVDSESDNGDGPIDMVRDATRTRVHESLGIWNHLENEEMVPEDLCLPEQDSSHHSHPLLTTCLGNEVSHHQVVNGKTGTVEGFKAIDDDEGFSDLDVRLDMDSESEVCLEAPCGLSRDDRSAYGVDGFVVMDF
ncbi:hypothetical protein BDN72DRAFT_874928 [Pluteus cervinus]|uniref:Uncharacterized protein n=1 Tax=Pluteus cervinus TaxID=181527 RepID=A0ACD3BCN0_9AGAR|nr:hypothetical protein BDN72DRAFT_874928 [Pluteus cervinus]